MKEYCSQSGVTHSKKSVATTTTDWSMKPNKRMNKTPRLVQAAWKSLAMNARGILKANRTPAVKTIHRYSKGHKLTPKIHVKDSIKFMHVLKSAYCWTWLSTGLSAAPARCHQNTLAIKPQCNKEQKAAEIIILDPPSEFIGALTDKLANKTAKQVTRVSALALRSVVSNLVE